MKSPTRFPTLLAIVALAAAVTGCAGWPVQEMSNARQAISAAQKAGAERYAPDTYAEARKLLSDASASARKGDYRAAHDQAEQSREKAIEARQAAEKAAAAEKAGKGEPAAPTAPPGS
jgi:hypothetical protein